MSFVQLAVPCGTSQRLAPLESVTSPHCRVRLRTVFNVFTCLDLSSRLCLILSIEIGLFASPADERHIRVLSYCDLLTVIIYYCQQTRRNSVLLYLIGEFEMFPGYSVVGSDQIVYINIHVRVVSH